MAQLEHRSIQTNNINLHVVQAGPESGPLVILLHGFPEFWYGWRHQIDYLADAGYRVWIPDQRGYNISDKPSGIPAYSIDQMAADVIGLIDVAGRDRAFLIGHDWGAAVAWWTANKYPERLHRLVILNVPHHSVMRRAMTSGNLRQTLRSWYIFFVQIPWLPERLATAFNRNALARVLKGTSRAGTFTDADLAHYREAWSQPGALTAMLNWYRAMFRKSVRRLPSRRITVPTLMIWGTHDVALGRELAQPSIDLCDDGRLVFIDEAGHWVQHEEPERVNALIGEFLRDK